MAVLVLSRRIISSRCRPGESLPQIPAGGFHSEDEIARLPGARRIDAKGLVPGPSADVYAFYRRHGPAEPLPHPDSLSAQGWHKIARRICNHDRQTISRYRTPDKPGAGAADSSCITDNPEVILRSQLF